VNVVELSSQCPVVGAVGVVELLLRCEAEGDVGGVVLDDHYHRSINVRPNERQNGRVRVRGGEILTQIPPRGPIASFVGFPAPLGSTSRSIDSWTLLNAPIARHAFGRKSEPRVPRRTRSLRCAAAKAKSLFPSFRSVHLNRRRTGLETHLEPSSSDGTHEPTADFGDLNLYITLHAILVGQYSFVCVRLYKLNVFKGQ
jgi:hypothetical protein